MHMNLPSQWMILILQRTISQRMALTWQVSQTFGMSDIVAHFDEHDKMERRDNYEGTDRGTGRRFT